MPRTNPTYPQEFRREAIRLVRASEQDYPIPKVAREIGVSPGTLRNWVRQEEIPAGDRDGLTTEEKEELRRLGCEVKTLRQEKEILHGSDLVSRARDQRGQVLARELADLDAKAAPPPRRTPTGRRGLLCPPCRRAQADSVARRDGRRPEARRLSRRPSFAGPGHHSDIRMTLATYTLAMLGTQVATTAALEEAFS